ncbi:MAG: glycosyltransferase family 4 protein [Chloroflexi bacterium]|nr:glycosyltransferase family 4 protein [Chloroflexota bacterium]
MKIGIDARFLTHPQKGGFKTYTENLIGALAEVDSENAYVLYLDREPDADARLPQQSNFSTRIVPGNFPVIGMPWREQIDLARQVARDRLDLFHAPSLSAPLFPPCPLVVTLHDMIWFFPDRFRHHQSWSAHRQMMEWYYRLVPAYAARHAAAILTVSHIAKTSILEHLNVDAARIFVTHEAAGKMFQQIDDRRAIEMARARHHLPAEFILAIGSADPRKNLETLVRAYAQLPAELQARLRLVIVWTGSVHLAELPRQIHALGLTARVQFLENISDADLVLLYNAATVFVFPSLCEGFGLPVLEAMACGTPVIAANNSSLPEVAGDAACLIAAEDVPGFARAITQVLSDASARAHWIAKGLARAASFSWTKCARLTLAGYAQATLNYAQERRN